MQGGAADPRLGRVGTQLASVLSQGGDPRLPALPAEPVPRAAGHDTCDRR